MLEKLARIEVELQGSLALTGVGHATPKAVVLGLLGLEPETLDPDTADSQVADVYVGKRLPLAGGRAIDLNRRRTSCLLIKCCRICTRTA